MLRRLFNLLVLAAVVGAFAYWWIAVRPLPLPESPYNFTVRTGATLRAVAHELTSAGVLPADWTLVGLARLSRADRSIKAGNYELSSGTTLAGLLAKLSQGDATQTSFTIVEGWSMRDLREALKGDEDIVKQVSDLPGAELMAKIGASEKEPEGWFFPDTYFFAAGATDASILVRAHKLMRQRLTAAWDARATDLPVTSAYQALILASLVEKETGRAADRPLVASVKRSHTTQVPASSRGHISRSQCSRRAANMSSVSVSFAIGSCSSSSRSRSPSGVPPGSRVTHTLRPPCSSSSFTCGRCVLLPAPSMPSSVRKRPRRALVDVKRDAE